MDRKWDVDPKLTIFLGLNHQARWDLRKPQWMVPGISSIATASSKSQGTKTL
jgi:hypothetical protein